MSYRYPAVIVCLCLLALSGCRHRGETTETTEDFAARLADDLVVLVQQVEDLAEAAGDLEARDTATACYETVGACSICYDVDGLPLAGTFEAGLEEPPCSASVSFRSASATYSIDEAEFSGSWAATSLAGDYSIAMVGSMSSTLETTTARAGTTTYDASWALDLAATTEDFVLVAWALTLDYDGFGDLSWSVDVTWDVDDGWVSTVTASDGSSCTVSGTIGAPSVECTAA